jgi:hypothetical protein
MVNDLPSLIMFALLLPSIFGIAAVVYWYRQHGYQHVKWGAHVEVKVLDPHTYRLDYHIGIVRYSIPGRLSLKVNGRDKPVNITPHDVCKVTVITGDEEFASIGIPLDSMTHLTRPEPAYHPQ